MAFFTDEMEALNHAWDEAMAEEFSFVPMVESRDKTAPAIVDAIRRPVTVMATYLDPEAKNLTPDAWDVREHLRPGIVAGSPRIEITTSELARLAVILGVPFASARPDLYTRTVNGAIYRVADVFVSALGTVRLKVNRVS